MVPVIPTSLLFHTPVEMMTSQRSGHGQIDSMALYISPASFCILQPFFFFFLLLSLFSFTGLRKSDAPPTDTVQFCTATRRMLTGSTTSAPSPHAVIGRSSSVRAKLATSTICGACSIEANVVPTRPPRGCVSDSQFSPRFDPFLPRSHLHFSFSLSICFSPANRVVIFY